MRHVRSGYRHTFTWENRRSTGATIGPVLAIAEVLRVVRAVLSLSLIQPRSRLPVTPLRPAEHYHTYGELERGARAPAGAPDRGAVHLHTHTATGVNPPRAPAGSCAPRAWDFYGFTAS